MKSNKDKKMPKEDLQVKDEHKKTKEDVAAPKASNKWSGNMTKNKKK